MAVSLSFTLSRWGSHCPLRIWWVYPKWTRGSSPRHSVPLSPFSGDWSWSGWFHNGSLPGELLKNIFQ